MGQGHTDRLAYVFNPQSPLWQMAKPKGEMRMPSAGSGFKDFARAMFGDWLARMSGPLSVPAVASALWVS